MLKTKFLWYVVSTILILILLIISVFSVMLYSYRVYSNLNFVFKGDSIYGFVQASYIMSGIKTPMTTNGKSTGPLRINYNGEQKGSAQTLKIVDDKYLALSRSTSFVVFEYTIANTDKNNTFVLFASYNDAQPDDQNIEMTWGAFDQPNFNFDLLTNDFASGISNFDVVPQSIVYVYIMIKISDLTVDAKMSGDFVFQLMSK